MASDNGLRRRALLFLLFTVTVGTAVGMTMSEHLGPVAQSRVMTSLDGYLYAVTGDGNVDKAYIFFHALIQNTQILLLFFLSGFSIAALPLNYGLVLFRTLCATFTYGCIAGRYGFLGATGAGVAMLIPAGITLCVLTTASRYATEKAVLDFTVCHRTAVENAYLRRFGLLWLGTVGVSFLDAFYTPAVFALFGGLIA